MTNPFFERPILNSPYEYPSQHWELDKSGQPTGQIIETRRGAEFISPIPKARKRTKSTQQELDIGAAHESGKQKYDPTPVINDLRSHIDQWRKLPNPSDWGVTHETQRLLEHWRHHKFQTLRPFFCQVEAVETIIYLTEVAPNRTSGKKYLEHLANANAEANPGLDRLALKLATGAGKTTVMAMTIAWQTINAVRRDSKKYTKGFLIVTPGITIKDRLRVLLPNDPENYYTTRELIPQEFLDPIKKAKIVITNYHAFQLRERFEVSKTGKSLLRGRGAELETKETHGQMLQRVMPDLMGIKNVMVLNDEAHHCYRSKPEDESEESTYKGDDRKEAESNKEAARVWISGLEIVQKKLGINRIVDLSATPFFLRGSGYPEGTLFHWVMSDFSLMDAIESGIVKLPRVPIADDIPTADVPVFRNLWEHIGKQMSKTGRGKMASADPHDLPPQLTGALEALYGHYAKTAELWKKVNIQVPPCFIIVCNNTATSKLVYDYITGFDRNHPDGSSTFVPGALELFRNYDEYGNRFARPNTLLIDSAQLESGDALDNDFRKTFGPEIEQFRREMIERGDATSAEKITDQDLLREVMNTVGRKDKLGESIRCVVSVSMLTEGWDTNTVTHVLGVRAFGTQLLCEQVIGRALRRYSYELKDGDRFDPEYADILGIPFDFTAKPVVAPPRAPPKTELVRALPERAGLEIRFPRVAGYRVELPSQSFDAIFNDDSYFELTPDLVGSANVLNSGIIGEQVNLTLDHTADVRPSQVSYELASHMVRFKWRDKDGNPQINQFLPFRRIVRRWIKDYLVCKGHTTPALLKYKALADIASEKIINAINRWVAAQAAPGENPILVTLDPFNPTGSTRYVRFNTSRGLWETDPRKCHINYVVLDSGWESEFCRVVEAHPKVFAYAKNHNLGLEVPYIMGGQPRRYLPDFLCLIDDGHGPENLLHLIVEIKGYRREDAKLKKDAIESRWIPGVNSLGSHGRWAFVELTDPYTMEDELAAQLESDFGKIIEAVASPTKA